MTIQREQLKQTLRELERRGDYSNAPLLLSILVGISYLLDVDVEKYNLAMKKAFASYLVLSDIEGDKEEELSKTVDEICNLLGGPEHL